MARVPSLSSGPAISPMRYTYSLSPFLTCGLFLFFNSYFVVSKNQTHMPSALPPGGPGEVRA